MEPFSLFESFTPLELLLIASLTSITGGVVMLAKWFYTYLMKTNKERAEEIQASIKVQTELKGVITHNNFLVEQLPDRIEDKIRVAIKK